MDNLWKCEACFYNYNDGDACENCDTPREGVVLSIEEIYEKVQQDEQTTDSLTPAAANPEDSKAETGTETGLEMKLEGNESGVTVGGPSAGNAATVVKKTTTGLKEKPMTLPVLR